VSADRRRTRTRAVTNLAATACIPTAWAASGFLDAMHVPAGVIVLFLAVVTRPFAQLVDPGYPRRRARRAAGATGRPRAPWARSL
jgi:hypothetical protein